MHRFLRTSFLLSILGILLTLGITSISSLLMMVGNILGDTRVTLATQIYHVARLFPHPRSLDATLDYNESRLLYKVARYTESVKKLKQIPQDSLRFEMLHNLGNTLYRLGQKTKDPQETIQNWQEALAAYSGALKIKKDPETLANYNFVEKKLEDFKKQQKSQEKDQKKQEASDGQSESSPGSTQSSSGDPSTSSGGQAKDATTEKNNSGSTQNQVGGGNNISGIWSNQGNFNAVGGTGSGTENLSENQKKQLEQYLQSLKWSEKENRQFFQLQPTPNQNRISDMIQNLFGSDPFFSSDIGGGKKDW